MKKILVSACLLGDPVRYDGHSKLLRHDGLARLVDCGRVIPFCPETAGGLPVPRPAAEIEGGDGARVIDGTARVVTSKGDDVSDEFLHGARQALAVCRTHAVQIAILTEKSPSCGSGSVYDGSFTRATIAGSGVTATLLRRNGIEVFSQFEIDAALARLEAGN